MKKEMSAEWIFNKEQILWPVDDSICKIAIYKFTVSWKRFWYLSVFEGNVRKICISPNHSAHIFSSSTLTHQTAPKFFNIRVLIKIIWNKKYLHSRKSYNLSLAALAWPMADVWSTHLLESEKMCVCVCVFMWFMNHSIQINENR